METQAVMASYKEVHKYMQNTTNQSPSVSSPPYCHSIAIETFSQAHRRHDSEQQHE